MRDLSRWMFDNESSLKTSKVAEQAMPWEMRADLEGVPIRIFRS